MDSEDSGGDKCPLEPTPKLPSLATSQTPPVIPRPNFWNLLPRQGLRRLAPVQRAGHGTRSSRRDYRTTVGADRRWDAPFRVLSLPGKRHSTSQPLLSIHGHTVGMALTAQALNMQKGFIVARSPRAAGPTSTRDGASPPFGQTVRHHRLRAGAGLQSWADEDVQFLLSYFQAT